MWSKWRERRAACDRWSALGRYNAEVARGIVHTAAYDRLMTEEQHRFDEEHGQTARTGLPIMLEPGQSVEFEVTDVE